MLMTWVGYALLSAIAAAATAILAKLGLKEVSSDLATAIRTSIVLIFAWMIVFAREESVELRSLSSRTWLFLGLSGLATGLSWLTYFKALSMAPAARVAPIDKLSLPLTVLIAWAVLGETVSTRLAIGVGLMLIGALLTLSA
jgi:bacterial/archaeal transporter family protein